MIIDDQDIVVFVTAIMIFVMVLFVSRNPKLIRTGTPKTALQIALTVDPNANLSDAETILNLVQRGEGKDLQDRIEDIEKQVNDYIFFKQKFVFVASCLAFLLALMSVIMATN